MFPFFTHSHPVSSGDEGSKITSRVFILSRSAATGILQLLQLKCSSSLRLTTVAVHRFFQQPPQWLVNTQLTDTHTNSGTTRSPCWPSRRHWSVWMEYKSAASWRSEERRPASVARARRSGAARRGAFGFVSKHTIQSNTQIRTKIPQKPTRENGAPAQFH